MKPVRLPRDEGLHPRHTHEWWYFFAQLHQDDGTEVHYTTALMRRDLLWVSYLRFWEAGKEPVFRRSIHVVDTQSPGDPELVVSPRRNWTVRLGIGRSAHELGKLGELHFRHAGRAPCLHTPAAGGGIRHYGEGLEMAWYSWPWLNVRGYRSHGNQRVALRGTGWMEHQWGNTDFTELSWRYTPIFIGDRRFIAFRYEHQSFPEAAQLEVGELTGGELQLIDGGSLTPTGPEGGLTTTVNLDQRGELTVVSRPGAEIRLHLPTVPVFYEGPSRVDGTLDGQSVQGIAITELHPIS